jgi:hypothetical protein
MGLMVEMDTAVKTTFLNVENGAPHTPLNVQKMEKMDAITKTPIKNGENGVRTQATLTPYTSALVFLQPSVLSAFGQLRVL